MSKDKIFNAEKGDYREELQDTSFRINPMSTPMFSSDYIDDIESIDSRDIAKIVEKVLEGWDKKMKKHSYNFKKTEIVEIYSEVRKKTLKYKRIQMMVILCNYLSIQPNKLYNFLGNAHKNEVIEELEESSNMISKRGIKRLF